MDSGTFLVEDFVNAISAQLDRVQDALRMKAVNRPLTFALKDFSLDLQVFAEMDNESNVRFRSAAPNETGASTLRLSFTTITRPMIEENTISLAATRSPTLDELGLRPDERQRLERLGVRNAAQLQTLGRVTGGNTVARYAGIPLDRLREALDSGRPTLHQIGPAPVQKTPVGRPPKGPNGHRFEAMPEKKFQVGPKPGLVAESPVSQIDLKGLPVMRVGRGISQLKLSGSNLLGTEGLPKVQLNNQSLDFADIDDDEITVNLPANSQSGPLEIELPDGQRFSYHLSVEDDQEPATSDPWAPRRAANEADPYTPR